MRKLGLLIVLALMLAIAVPVSAAGPASYESSMNVTNTTGSTGHITLDYYNTSGSVVASYSDTLDPYETVWYITLPGLSSSFDGSVVISSDVPLGSTSTVIGKDGSDVAMNYADYVGKSAGTGSVYLPLLMDSNYGYSTFFYVQNVSTSNVDVAITYSDGLVVSGITALAPGASAKIDNQAEAHTSAKFSATLTATGGDIVAAVVEWGDGSYGNPLLAYNGFGNGSQYPVMPMVNENNYGYWTAIPIQNMGGSPTTVTVSYTPTKAGTACTETMDIPAYAQREFGSYAFAYSGVPGTNWSTTCTLHETFVGSAVVTVNSAGMDLVGLMNQSSTLSAGTDKGGTIMTFNASDATDTVIFPDIRQWHGTYAWWSSITIVNLSGGTLAASDITCHAVGSDNGGPVDTTFSNSSSIADGAGWITDFYPGLSPLGDGFVGGVICVSGSGGEIVGMDNVLGMTSPGDLDALVSFEGINQ